jgi:hypothetical protein
MAPAMTVRRVKLNDDYVTMGASDGQSIPALPAIPPAVEVLRQAYNAKKRRARTAARIAAERKRLAA